MLQKLLAVVLIGAFTLLSVATAAPRRLSRSEGTVVEAATPTAPHQPQARPAVARTVIWAVPRYGGRFYGLPLEVGFEPVRDVTLTDARGRFAFERSAQAGTWLIVHAARRGAAVARSGIEARSEREGSSFPVMAAEEYYVERAHIEVWHRGLAAPPTCAAGRCRSAAPPDACGLLVAVAAAPPGILPDVFAAPAAAEARLPAGFRGEVFALWEGAGLPLTVTEVAWVDADPAP